MYLVKMKKWQDKKYSVIKKHRMVESPSHVHNPSNADCEYMLALLDITRGEWKQTFPALIVDSNSSDGQIYQFSNYFESASLRAKSMLSY